MILVVEKGLMKFETLMVKVDIVVALVATVNPIDTLLAVIVQLAIVKLVVLYNIS